MVDYLIRHGGKVNLEVDQPNPDTGELPVFVLTCFFEKRMDLLKLELRFEFFLLSFLFFFILVEYYLVSACL